MSAPGLDPSDGRTPVIVDDIASTGHTIAEAVRGLVRAGHPAPICVAVHGVFGFAEQVPPDLPTYRRVAAQEPLHDGVSQGSFRRW